jgi:hypothetical protein
VRHLAPEPFASGNASDQTHHALRPVRPGPPSMTVAHRCLAKSPLAARGQLTSLIKSRCCFGLTAFAMRDSNSVRHRYPHALDNWRHVRTAILEHPVCTPNRDYASRGKPCIHRTGRQPCHACDLGRGEHGTYRRVCLREPVVRGHRTNVGRSAPVLTASPPQFHHSSVRPISGVVNDSPANRSL